tara:strand:- start:2414 stop:2653 length:240 start_codon:yes stop_codon:yes gene_type:complete
MDMNVLNRLHTMHVVTSKDAAVKLIDTTKTKKLVLNRLLYDISVARSAAEVSRIMWQVYMSGSGYGTIGSTWKKHYADA